MDGWIHTLPSQLVFLLSLFAFEVVCIWRAWVEWCSVYKRRGREGGNSVGGAVGVGKSLAGYGSGFLLCCLSDLVDGCAVESCVGFQEACG